MREFKKLHEQEDPLLIANVWDVPSSKTAEKLNFQALGTSSAAIAAMLGYEDGEEMRFSELEYIVQRIAANTTLPLSVDLESGYSREPKEIADHIRRLANLGVVGINIEDSLVDGDRSLMNANAFASILSEVKDELTKSGQNVFLNVRSDTFLLGLAHAVEETQKRIRLYEKAGADGIFIPCVENENDIEAIVKSTPLPVNVMCMPGLPDFERLKALGVRRISMGNFLFGALQKNYEGMLDQVITQNTFKSVFEYSKN
ncbi:MAG: isocitrate lyase/phosphoenolpyruvate mutase family protein [Reichenbachiella sp.]|uniref:isocitrate lyase/PEP mutase family protein n=1 Tax=Reichenbachiella sp. TaxID=2184521 RepID=UPI0032651C4E